MDVRISLMRGNVLLMNGSCAWIDGDLFGCAFWGETPVRYGEMRAEGGTRGR
jgi:hypothetical protein